MSGVKRVFLQFDGNEKIPALCTARIQQSGGLNEGWLECKTPNPSVEQRQTVLNAFTQGKSDIKVFANTDDKLLADFQGIIRSWQDDSFVVTIARAPKVFEVELLS